MTVGIWRDVQLALRLLLKSPGFTLVAVFSLALGIGANTAIFSVVSALFLQPIPVYEPDRLVAIYTLDERNPGHHPLSVHNGRDLRERATLLSDAAGFTFMPGEISRGEEGGGVPALLVTGHYFRTLGVEAELGRTFDHGDDDAIGAHPEVVVSHSLWQELGADPAIVGSELVVNGHPLVVVGVTPQSFRGTGLFEAKLWVPWSMGKLMMPDVPWLDSRRWLASQLFGRLADGVSVEQADDELRTIGSALAVEHPDENGTRTFTAVPLAHALLGPDQRDRLVAMSIVLSTVVGLVLLIACANVANLLLARASVRRAEIALRRVVGASTGRLMRQLLTESLVLAVLAGAVGIVLALPMLEALWAMRPPGLALGGVEPSLEPRVLAFSLAISMLTGVLFGLAPAIRATRVDLTSPLKEETTPSTAAGARYGLRAVRVVLQMALSLVALVGAGLFIRSMQNIVDVDPGFDTDRVLVAGVPIGKIEGDESRRATVQREIVAALESQPEIERAAFATAAPLTGNLQMRTTFVDGRDVEGAADGVLTHALMITPGYFATMGITLLEGRDVAHEDDMKHARVVFVNEAFARRYFRDGRAAGRTVRFFGEPGTIEIAGVIEDIKYLQLTEKPLPMLFLPMAQWPQPFVQLHVRARGDATTLGPVVERRVAELGLGIELQGSEPLRRIVEDSAWAARLAATLLGVFGALALGLAAIGIYGVMSYEVRQRTREIGIRMVLGARPFDVLRHVLSRGMFLVAIGVVVGVVGGVLLRAALAELLFGVGLFDPIAFGGAAAILVAVALVAAWVPARRATRIQPVAALRME